MSRLRLTELLQPMVDAIMPVDELKAMQASRAAIGDDATIAAGSLYPSLPMTRFDWWIPGSSDAGTNVGVELKTVTAGTIKHLNAYLKVGSSQAKTVWLTVNGGRKASLSLGIGGRSASRAVNVPYGAGDVLRIDILGSGGSGMTVSAHGDVREGLT